MGETDIHTVRTIEDRIAEHYASLSDKLRGAADYVVANPLDVATRSLRTVSAASGVSPATFSRLARAIGLESFEQLRELSRGSVARTTVSFAEKAGRLQSDSKDVGTIFERQTRACAGNVLAMLEEIDPARLDAAVAALHEARQVVLIGAYASTGIVEYMAYLANYFRSNWTLAGRMGASLGSVLAPLGPEDTVLVVTKSPFARRAIVAMQLAADRGARTILITDNHTCPAIPFAGVHFIVPSESPMFFSSYAATLVLVEAMIAMLVSRSESGTGDRIREVEAQNKALGDYWSG